MKDKNRFDFDAALAQAKKSPAFWQEDLLLTVAQQLVDKMAAKNISRVELAHRLNVSPAYITKVLRGHANLTLETLAKIAFALGEKWNVLLTKLNGNINATAQSSRRQFILPSLNFLEIEKQKQPIVPEPALMVREDEARYGRGRPELGTTLRNKPAKRRVMRKNA